LLLDSVGAVKVAGFAVETDSGPQIPAEAGYAPAQPGTPEQRGAYGLAALLVHLLGGERPGNAGSDASRQDAVIRRSVIRVLARPGEAVPEAIIDLIKAGLSFEPDRRPEFTAMEDELARAATELGSMALRTWAPSAVPGLLQQQEAGYPDRDSTRLRRHIDLENDSSSYDAPPVRSRATESTPRDVATVLAKVDVAAALAAAEEQIARDTSGMVSQTSFGAIPTSETDVKVANEVILAAERAEPAPVQLDIGGPDDTWEIEPEPEGKMGGWPLIAGLVIGMVVAAVVGWVAVEHMVEQAPSEAEQVPMMATPGSLASEPPTKPIAEPPALSDEIIEQPVDEVVPEAEPEGEEAVEVVEPEEVAAEPVVTPPSPPVVERTPLAPRTVPPAAPVPDVFTVTFRNGSSTIDRLVVRCHKGGVGEGAEVVYIAGAGKGPCRVEGYTGGDKIAVSAILTGPQNFTCFEGNARLCR
jgi:hypothetical protein